MDSQATIDYDKKRFAEEWNRLKVNSHLHTILRCRAVYDIANHNNEMLDILDRNAGIDYLVKTKDDLTVPIAGRILRTNDPSKGYFSIRYVKETGCETEVDKVRKTLTENGALHPKWSVVALVVNDLLHSIATIHWPSFMKWVCLEEIRTEKFSKNVRNLTLETNSQDGTQYLKVLWNSLPHEQTHYYLDLPISPRIEEV